jgi:outer membrane murein-binding lipoprotein Lpp
MNNLHSMKKLLLPALIIGILFSTGCASQSKVTLLTAAGFRTVVPSTQAQIAQLKTMPQRKVVPVVKKGKTSFLYADSTRNVLLIGNESQYQQYQQYNLQYKIQQSQEETAALNADAADWGCWGGGVWGPGFY